MSESQDPAYVALRDACRAYFALDGCGNARDEQQRRRNAVARLVGAGYVEVTQVYPRPGAEH